MIRDERQSISLPFFERHPEYSHLVEQVNIDRIRDRIDILSGIAHGGKIGEGGGRGQFTQEDFRARETMEDWVWQMAGGQAVSDRVETYPQAGRLRRSESLGLSVWQNPSGLVVYFEGEDPEKDEPSVAGSHTDTIYNDAGTEDGQEGCAAAFETLEILVNNFRETGKKPKRGFAVLIVTGEDTPPYFSGSQALVRGLNKEVLDTVLTQDITLREGILNWARHFGIKDLKEENVDRVMSQPLLDQSPYSWSWMYSHLELHPFPNNSSRELPDMLMSAEKVLGSTKLKLTLEKIPSIKQVDSETITSNALISFGIRVTGTEGHAASLPMEERVDAVRLVLAWRQKIREILSQEKYRGITLYPFEFSIPNGVPNRVAGLSEMYFTLAYPVQDRSKQREVSKLLMQARREIEDEIKQAKTKELGEEKSAADFLDISVPAIAFSPHYKPEDLDYLLDLAEKYIYLIDYTCRESTAHHSNMYQTATVGTIGLRNGKIEFTLDLRSEGKTALKVLIYDLIKTFFYPPLNVAKQMIVPLFKRDALIMGSYIKRLKLDPVVRDLTFDRVMYLEKDKSTKNPFPYILSIDGPLSGSEPPVTMDPGLIEELDELGKRFAGVPVPKKLIFAGEDHQVLVERVVNGRIGMIFPASNNTHKKDEQTPVEALEKAAKVLVAQKISEVYED